MLLTGRGTRARDEDPEEDRESAEPRHGAEVHAPRLAQLVDDTEDARDAADGQGQDDDDQEYDQEAPEDVPGSL